MNRRELFKTTAVAAVGAGLAMAHTDCAFAAPRPSAQTIETRDRSLLYYKDWGAGAPIVFVHGWCLSSDFWQYQMIQLAEEGFRCVAYDRRGHGRSSDPGRGYDYDTLADDLASIIERLRLQKVTLVAHSMGGGEVVRYLSRHGTSRVARIVLLAPTTPLLCKTADNPAGIDRKIFDSMRVAWIHDFPKMLSDNARPFFTKDTSPQLIEWGIRMMLQCSMKATVDCALAMQETDFRNELRRITVPALVIQGDADASAPLAITGRRTAELIPGSTFKVYEGAPHGFPLTHIDRLNADLREFCR